MKRTVLMLAVMVIITTNELLAQENDPVGHNNTNGKNNAAVLGPSVPIGEFSKTHIMAISLGYSWSHHRFGRLDFLPENPVGFIANGGIDYYIGRRETVAGNPFRYGGYWYLHAFGGAIFNYNGKGNISLTGGPTLGIYKRSSNAGFGLTLNSSYSLTDKIAISPGLNFFKHKNAAALWTVSLLAEYAF